MDINKTDLEELTDYWYKETNRINESIDYEFKNAQDYAYQLGFNRALKEQQTEITRLNAIIASQDETIKIMEDLINSEPRTFDKDIWESLSDKSIKLAKKCK